jgi:methylase of polypeptide subunit release factors
VVIEEALLELLQRLESAGYDFVTPTPSTHRRVLANRPGQTARTLRDVFGWSLPFAPGLVGGCLLEVLELAEALVEAGGLYRSRYRVSRVRGKLFLHSAYPTTGTEAVFLGPDSYRFVDFVLGEVNDAPRRLCDLGAGSGVGGICLGACFPDARVTLADANPQALCLARINAAAAGVVVDTVEADALDALAGDLDLIIANPPYLVDEARRAYRHGGGPLGSDLSLAWALGGARRLEAGGRLLLYTGSAIVDGHDALRAGLERELPGLDCALRYRELDPDVFGEELDRDPYRGTERIAAVGAVIRKAG